MSHVLKDDSKACNRGASRHFEAERGVTEATSWTQNILTQGQSETHGDSKLYNSIVESPSRAELEVGNLGVLLEF
jgi:hypothetical protein